jgi:hypothetical protein
MKTIHLEKSQIPNQLRFGGNQFKAVISDTISIYNHAGYWSGGSKTSFFVFRLSDNKQITLTDTYLHPGKTEAGYKKHMIMPGYIIVEHSYFCGKDHGYTFHVNPVNKNLFNIKENNRDITDFELIVLEYTSKLKNTYGGRTNIRFIEANIDKKITQDQWSIAKQSLITKKMLNKAGAIQPSGRNAIA